MDPGLSPYLPQADQDDAAYAVIKTALNLSTGGIAGELFALFVRLKRDRYEVPSDLKQALDVAWWRLRY